MVKKLSKRVEYTTGKGEIARYEQFLFFPLCFLKTCILKTRKNQDLFGKGVEKEPSPIAQSVALQT